MNFHRVAVVCSEPFGSGANALQLSPEDRLVYLRERVPTYVPPERTTQALKQFVQQWGVPQDGLFRKYLRVLDDPTFAAHGGCRRALRWCYLVTADGANVAVGVNGYIDPMHLHNPSMLHLCPQWPCARVASEASDEWLGREDYLDCPSFGGEAVAIVNARRNGIDLKGATLLAPYEPCEDCWNFVIWSGISTVVHDFPHKLAKLQPQRHAAIKARVRAAKIREVNVRGVLRAGFSEPHHLQLGRELVQMQDAREAGYWPPDRPPQP